MGISALLVLQIVLALTVGFVLAYVVHELLEEFLGVVSILPVLGSLLAFGGGVFLWKWVLALALAAGIIGGAGVGVVALRKYASQEAKNQREIDRLKARIAKEQNLEYQQKEIARLRAQVEELDAERLRALLGEHAEEFESLLRGSTSTRSAMMRSR